MSDTNTVHWKDKYLAALEEFETSQKRDQQRLELLKRGLGRVSLAAEGLDGSLDEQLNEIRSALRGGRDIQTLEPVIAQLERTIVALDDRRRDEQSQLQEQIDNQLEQYLKLDLPRSDKSSLKKLRKSLPQLLQGNGPNNDIFTRLNHANNLVIQQLLQQLESGGPSNRGILSRLFSHQSNEDATDPVANDNVNEPDEHNPERLAAFDLNNQTSTDNVDLANPELRTRLQNILGKLLEQVDVPPDYMTRKEQLLDRIQSAPLQIEELPDLLDEAAQLVASTRLLAQQEMQGFLVALHQRLDDIQNFLVSARKDEERSQENQNKLDQEVRQELAEMKQNLQGNGDLHTLKQAIDSMVGRIVSAVDLFRAEEQQRRDDVYKRLETMTQRIATMEQEAVQLKNNLEAQRADALRDSLTELPNRAAYNDAIASEYSRWRRHGHPLSIAVIDIDHFKSVNDTLGHLRGDKVLKLVAREISRRVRSEDMVARYGGEEFVVIMPETDLASAFAAMEKVRQAVSDCPFNFNQKRLPVTISAGLASFQEGDEIDQCFDRADKALYRAKEAGRNRVERG